MDSYLEEIPGSSLAINMKACIKFRLQDGTAAESELKNLQRHIFEANDFLRHNLVVFSNGEKALEILPPLVDQLPEARLNLALYYLRKSAVDDAYELTKNLQPKSPAETILLATVHAMKWNQSKDKKSLKLAQKYFQSVGASLTECDTVPGRQCMASCFFLMQQFDDANVYFSSISNYLGQYTLFVVSNFGRSFSNLIFQLSNLTLTKVYAFFASPTFR